MIANVYVDGFNLFYGCPKGTRHKWLDLDALCRTMLPDDQINRIRYFTARVETRPDDPDCRNKQDFYLRALSTLPNVEIHLGRFQRTTTRMMLADPVEGQPPTVRVIKIEEKRSDANLASHMLADGFDQDGDLSILVSNDSDLAEPIRLLREKIGLRVGILTPRPDRPCARDLVDAGPLFVRNIRETALEACQFPEQLKDRAGTFTRPARW